MLSSLDEAAAKAQQRLDAVTNVPCTVAVPRAVEVPLAEIVAATDGFCHQRLIGSGTIYVDRTHQPCPPCDTHAHQPWALCDHCLAGGFGRVYASEPLPSLTHEARRTAV